MILYSEENSQGRHYTFENFNEIWKKVVRRFFFENSSGTLIGSTSKSQNEFVDYLRSVDGLRIFLGEKISKNEGQSIYRALILLKGWNKDPNNDKYTDKIVLGIRYAKALEAYAEGYQPAAKQLSDTTQNPPPVQVHDIPAVGMGGGGEESLIQEVLQNNENKVALNSEIVKPVMDTIIKELNNLHFLKDKLNIPISPIFINSLWPKLAIDNFWRLTVDEAKRALENVPIINDAVAAIHTTPDWRIFPIEINYTPILYSELLSVLTNRNIKTLTTNAVLFSSKAEKILIQRRSQESRFYKGKYHTFGGAFKPFHNGKDGDVSLELSAIREIMEETRLSINIEKDTPMLIIDEFELNYIQLNFLGIDIPADRLYYALGLTESWEGKIGLIRFIDLEEDLIKFDKWTPSGWTQTMVWLALNCPGSKNDLRFSDNKSGRELYNSIMGQISRSNSK